MIYTKDLHRYQYQWILSTDLNAIKEEKHYSMSINMILQRVKQVSQIRSPGNIILRKRKVSNRFLNICENKCSILK